MTKHIQMILISLVLSMLGMLFISMFQAFGTMQNHQQHTQTRLDTLLFEAVHENRRLFETWHGLYDSERLFLLWDPDHPQRGIGCIKLAGQPHTAHRFEKNETGLILKIEQPPTQNQHRLCDSMN